MKRAMASVAAASMSLSLIQVPVLAAPPANLVNRAADFTIEVPSEEGGHSAGNLVDGDDNSLWVANGAQWPSTIRFMTPLDGPAIYKVVVKFEKGFANRSMDLKLQHIVNNVVDQPIIDVEKDDFSLADTLTFTWDEGMKCSEIDLVLSDPLTDGATGQFWPGVAEVEIYTQKEESEPQPGDLINIAPNGTISSITPGQGNPANLVDGDYKSLYVFSRGLSTTGGQAWVQVDFNKPQKVNAIEAAFENLGANDSSQFEFTYDILSKAGADDAEWTVLAENQTATRVDGDCVKMVSFDEQKTVQTVRVLIKSITNTGGDPWPALAELKILSMQDATTDIPAGTNIAENKPIHTNTGAANVSKIVDGRLNTVWNGEMYPAYIDIDLEKNYTLDEAIVYTPEAGYSQYSIYTSMDGKDFERVARKTNKDQATSDGETWQLAGKEARFVRLYMEYNSSSSKSQVREFVLHGEESGTPVQETPEVVVADFEDTDYAKPITQADTIAEVQGIIERRLGAQYKDWFTFELKDAANGYDYYDVEAKDGKIHITGNNGVSLATGLNAYLEKVANVHISQVGDQVTMPESIVLPEVKLHKETKYPVRYSYNYCTLSYSMAFWGEEEWRNELDWLALNGVNVVLDATGMEEVWRRFLGECGYTHQEIKDFIAGPAYYAWFYMANLTNMGGPVPDDWFAQRTELARKNQRIMRSLGMQPVLQGYCGMVPVDFKDKQPDAKIIPQGKWCSFQRPYMLKTDDPSFDKYAEMFYRAQKSVYGDVTDYYATDPFHEGGNTGGMNVTTIAQRTLGAMMEADPDAVWIIQSWQGNPSNGLLAGLEGNRDHALVLDLYAERQPHWNATSGYGEGEFADTPWAFCMLNNFGGRLGLYGHLESLNKNIPAAANQAKHMAGIGITPEASQNNPLLYEFFFDTIWTEDADAPLGVIDLDQWLADYARRRYGDESASAVEALKIMSDTVYAGTQHEASGAGGIGQGAPENVVNARPRDGVINSASTWGWSSILYSKKELEKSLDLLLEDWDKLNASEAYRYDVVTLAQQVMSNSAQSIVLQMRAAANANDLEEFTRWSDMLLDLIETSDKLLSTQKIYTLGNWTEAAGRLIENPDDFTADLFDLNAKALVSTWGSIDQSNAGGLSDYSNRQWSGLTKDLYLKRWNMYITEKKKQLAGENYRTFNNADWFELEWAWARDNETKYSEVPTNEDVEALARKVLTDFSNQKIDPEVVLENILEPSKMSAKAGSQSSGDPASNVLDENAGTIWHTDWSGANGTDRVNCWIELDFDEEATLDSLLYLPRGGAGNGTITKYRVEAEIDGQFKEVASGTWNASNGWKEAVFAEPVTTSKVKLIAVESVNVEANTKNFASAASIRLKGKWGAGETTTLDTALLQVFYRYASALDLSKYLDKGTTKADLQTQIDDAKEILDGAEGKTQDDVNNTLTNGNRALLEMRLTPNEDLLKGRYN